MSLDTAPREATTLAPDRSPRPSYRFWRGPDDDAPWIRPTLVTLLGATALLYLWGLGASGWANSFYSAAAQAGSESWKAFFFGSSDAANAITVDKPPLSLWAMGLSVRVFGLSSWSILVPEALMGVASVGLLYATVRRTTASAEAGLLAGLVLATTPVAALMFRFNNPDALLALLLIGSAAATIRAVEASRSTTPAGRRTSTALRWLALAGALVGLAFLTKMLQAFLVLPGLAGGYLLAAEGTVRTRFRHVLVAGLSMIAAAGWWIAIVALWPAASRPFIGGSADNSILELTLGYNGFGRLTGDETGSVGGQSGWGSTGLLRLFNSEIGGQVAWLLPSALILAVATGWLGRRAARTDLLRAGLVVWAGWLVVTALTFSLMQGIFHPYYTVALAPAIGALVGIGAVTAWRHRDAVAGPLALGAAMAAAATMGFVLLGRSDGYLPGLRWVVLVGGLAVALALCAVAVLKPWAVAAVSAASVVLALAGPAAFSISTAATPHEGSIPSAGPSALSGAPGGIAGLMLGGPAGAVTGQFPGFGGNGGTQGGGVRAGAGSSTGGLLNASEPSEALVSLLEADAADYTWVAATVGSNSASGYQLATQEPVMPIGGFNGTDPSPTLAEFEAMVARGEVHYFIGDEFGFGGITPGGQQTSEISEWVTANFEAQSVDGVTVYDLSAGAL